MAVRKRAESSFSGASSAATAASSWRCRRAPLAAHARRRVGVGLACRDKLPIELGRIRSSPASIAASCRRMSLAERRQRVRFDPMLAGEATNVEQPRLDLIEPGRIESQGVGRARNPVFGFARLDQGAVEGRQGFGQQRMFGRAALDPPRRLPKLGQRAVRTAEQLVEPGQRFPGLEPGLHRRPLLGEARLLALFGRKGLDFAAGMVEPIAVALGRRPASARARIKLALDPRDLGPGGLDLAGVEPAERVEQGAVALGVEQAAVVMLAVDFDGQRADVAEQAGRHCGGRRQRRGCRRRSSASAG